MTGQHGGTCDPQARFLSVVCSRTRIRGRSDSQTNILFTNLANVVLKDPLNYINRRRQTIGNLKVDEDTFRWFRTGSRPATPISALGNYHFFHAEASGYRVPWEMLQAVFSTADLDQWQVIGNIVRGIFQWWFDFKRTIPGCSQTSIGGRFIQYCERVVPGTHARQRLFCLVDSFYLVVICFLFSPCHHFF